MTKIYRHVKTGHEYAVLDGEHIRESDLEPMTSYIRYGATPHDPRIWLRPTAEFMDGRFEFVEDIGPPDDFDPLRDIEEFHQKFGLEYDGLPRTLTGELGQFRHQFLFEELDEWGDNRRDAADELTRAPKYRDHANYTYHLEEQFDALIDLLYVLMGTAYLQGFGPIFREGWRRVHEANMKKVRAERAEDSKRGTTFDVVKPNGWEPPTHTDLVEVNEVTKQ